MRVALPEFENSMTTAQKVWGFIYLPLHMFVLPLFLSMLAAYLPEQLDEITLNVAYYAMGFGFCLLLMWRYLRHSFDLLCDNVPLNIAAFICAFALYFFLNILASVALLAVLGDELLNPNNAALSELAESNSGVMWGLSVFLAPLAEEILFRGVLFGSLRGKNRTLAFAISIAAFGIYHLWQSALVEMDWRVFLYALQYIAPGYALAWLYEKTSCIWLPIFMHMLINLAAMMIL